MRLLISAVFCLFIQIVSFQHSEGKAVAAAIQKMARKELKGKSLYFSQHSRSNGFLKSSFFEDLPALSHTQTKCCKSPFLSQARQQHGLVSSMVIPDARYFYFSSPYDYSPDHWCPKHAFW